MHGANGLVEYELKKTIRRGIGKINYYSTTSKAVADVLSQKMYNKLHDTVNDVKETIKNEQKT